MATIRFEWDAAKNLANQKKHRVSFELATLVFQDSLSVYLKERVEAGEQRWQAIGMVNGCLLLTVAHASVVKSEFGQEIEVVRIISARGATRAERYFYEKENG